MNSIDFLVNTLFDLYIMIILLRIWLQLAQADFYNPLSQFIVKATQPLTKPLRVILPTFSRWDLASVVLVFLVIALKIGVLSSLRNIEFSVEALLISSLYFLVSKIFKILFWVMILRAILSWISRGNNPIEMVSIQLTEPFLAPIRRFMPAMGGLDLSMLVALFGLQFFEKFIMDLLRNIF